MRLEKEESQLCTLEAWKANYFLQDYHMYARTRNRSNITRVVIISDFLRKRFLWKQDPENCKPQRDNRLKVRESISKVVLSSILCFDDGNENFPFIYKSNEQCIFVPSKNTAKLTNHEINPRHFFFENFQARKRKAENFASYVTQSFRLLCSKYCVTFVHFCGF